MRRAGRKPKKNLLTSENPKTGAVTPETVGIRSMEMLRFPSVTHLSERVQNGGERVTENDYFQTGRSRTRCDSLLLPHR